MDSHHRSIFKAISWRTLGTIITTLLIYLFTHRWKLAFGIGFSEIFVKIAAYYIHERMWELVRR